MWGGGGDCAYMRLEYEDEGTSYVYDIVYIYVYAYVYVYVMYM